MLAAVTAPNASARVPQRSSFATGAQQLVVALCRASVCTPSLKCSTTAVNAVSYYTQCALTSHIPAYAVILQLSCWRTMA
eukprot:18731-Heterococcus_DN1.PRE.1